MLGVESPGTGINTVRVELDLDSNHTTELVPECSLFHVTALSSHITLMAYVYAVTAVDRDRLVRGSHLRASAHLEGVADPHLT